ncbi:MAG: hypothetical protein ACRD12_19465, partial [Acidimicrobiales bacterium]
MIPLLVAVRRRLRVAWILATAQLVAPAIAAGALVLVLVGRVRPWGWPEPAAAVLGVAAVVGLLVAGVALRVPLPVAARAADRGLATGDAFATALELEHRPPSPLADRVQTRAIDLACAGRAAEAVPFRLQARRLAVVAVLVAGAVALAVAVNHQDAVRRRQAAEHQVLQAEAERLRVDAEDLRRSGASPSQEDVARRIEDLAREVAAAGNLEEARSAVDDMARELADRLSPDLLAQKAAVRGLDRTLAAAPLPQAGSGDAASQLQALASALGSLDAGARSA